MKSLIPIFCLLLIPLRAFALQPGPGIAEPDRLNLTLSTTWVRGTAHEYVYDTETGLRISQLDWDIEDIVMAGGVLSARVGSRGSISLGLWGALNNGAGYQVDRDWNYDLGQDWSDWSMSPAELNKGWMLDLSAAFAIPLSPSGLVFSPLAGVKFDLWEWEDHGGSYIYSRNGEWRNAAGSFPDAPGIRYEQKFFAPYLGARLEGSSGPIHFSVYARASAWALSRAKDEHLNRNLVFKDAVNGQSFAGAGLELGWKLTRETCISLGYDFQKFFDAKGDSRGLDLTDGSSWTDINGAGTGLSLHGIHLSVHIRF